MTGVLTLLAGMAAIAGGLILLLAPPRRADRPTGVAGALHSIETEYAGRAGGGTTPASRDERLAEPLMRRLRMLAKSLSPGTGPERLQHRLDIAGNPGTWTPERILAYKGLGLFLLGATGALIASGSVVGLLLGAAVGAAAGFFLPDILLYNAGLRRQAELHRALPDILDLLVVSVEAGLGFDAALTRVAQNTDGPLADELARVLQEIRIGKSRQDALRAMGERVSVEEVRAFIAALVQAGELGMPIGQVLREQAREARIKRRQQAEEAAQKVPVKIIFPVVMCILPALLIVVVGPGILSIMESPLFR
ncbi:tight adherence protein C [Thermomonospora echinospora]|uniref:Tight adherence protein C n=1 Tax=Thermomonospora echinospora TaxID=1992 RepID=A0A1H5X117_9ACTN|nr:type II secretion system F family protein [Thermomonospora echinospora]SEG05471.1 tight adherence protein C [Thermomonospora echinospora]